MLQKILCIDDNLITLTLTKKVINKSKFFNEIITCGNGQEALQYFNSIKQDGDSKDGPQLIFLDLNMPVMGGWEFLDYFNSPEFSDFNTINIIILSSTIDPKDLEKAKKYPMVLDFFSKPITQNMLEVLKNKIS